MKRFSLFALMLGLVTIPAVAANKNPSINIPIDVQVGSTLVPAGDYNLTITGTAPDVQVTINKGNKAIVSFPAKEVQSKGLTSVSAQGSGKVPNLESIQLHEFLLVLQDAAH